jgi:hypothetical protein
MMAPALGAWLSGEWGDPDVDVPRGVAVRRAGARERALTSKFPCLDAKFL